MTSGYTLRRATADDAEALARGAVAGVSRYGEFAPGWRGPGYEQELAHAVASLADPDYHAFVAEGWHAVTEPYFDAIPGLTMLEYRRPLG